MTVKKFSPKQYQGKQRVYSPVPNAPRISKLWVWNAERNCYEPTESGCLFQARKYDGNRKRETRFFVTIEEAREWQSASDKIPQKVEVLQTHLVGPKFSDISAEWKRRTYPSLAESTRASYDKLIKLYLGGLMNFGIYEITPQRLDLWLDDLKDPKSVTMRSRHRRSFEHELKIVSAILRYYDNYNDDFNFRYPIKKRHKEAVELNRPYTPKHKDLTEDQFVKFRKELNGVMYGETLAALATVQYYQALRISEAAGLHWDDVHFDLSTPHRSRLTIVRAVRWTRDKTKRSYVESGFKNSKANGGIKEQPMFPESFKALFPFYKSGDRGLIFQADGKHFEYRTIQHAYDSAFKRAGLPYSGTHVLRHGGCRMLLNETGDMTIAKQHLGNTDMATVEIYARREASALTKVVRGKWEHEMTETGCKWLQPPTLKKII